MSDVETIFQRYLAERREQGLERALMSVRHEGARHLVVDGRRYLNFSSNDYLGLCAHPLIIERAREWTSRYGGGAGASRLVTGNLELFARLEEKLARLKGTQAALVMASGFQANAAVLQAVLDRTVLKAEPLVLADRLNHASMHFGCAAAGVRQIRYRHCDLEHCEELLAKHAHDGRPKFILTESVFSMDGDVAPVADLAKLAREHDAYLICDDAHATGVLGLKGRGLSAGADLVIGTFSKAMGSFGAYVTGSSDLCAYLVNRCGGLIYSTALPPSVLGAIDAALDLLPGLEDVRQKVAAHAQRFRTEAAAHGFDTGASRSQIVPVIVGGADRVLDLSGALRRAGLWVTAIRPPTVPNGTARLRVAFSAAHETEDVDRLLEALTGQPAVAA